MNTTSFDDAHGIERWWLECRPIIVAGDASPPARVTTIGRAGFTAERWWRDRHFAEWCSARSGG